MCLQDVAELFPVQQRIGQGQQVLDCPMEDGRAKREQIDPKLIALAVIALVVCKLNEADDLIQGFKVPVALLFGLAVGNFLQDSF